MALGPTVLAQSCLLVTHSDKKKNFLTWHAQHNRDGDFFAEPKQFQINQRFIPTGLSSILNCPTDMMPHNKITKGSFCQAPCIYAYYHHSPLPTTNHHIDLIEYFMETYVHQIPSYHHPLQGIILMLLPSPSIPPLPQLPSMLCQACQTTMQTSNNNIRGEMCLFIGTGCIFFRSQDQYRRFDINGASPKAARPLTQLSSVLVYKARASFRQCFQRDNYPLYHVSQAQNHFVAAQ